MSMGMAKEHRNSHKYAIAVKDWSKVHASCLYRRMYGVSSWKFKEAETAVRGEQTIIILKKCGRI